MRKSTNAIMTLNTKKENLTQKQNNRPRNTQKNPKLDDVRF